MPALRWQRGFSGQVVLALLVSCAIVSVRFLWEGQLGFNIWDEGFFWYGSQRVTLGDVPIRDFMAYDPGRYYWTSALMRLLGDDGIITQRLAITAFQCIACAIGLLVLMRCEPRLDLALFAMCVTSLVAWMEPQHKLLDVLMPLLLIGVFTFAVRRPSILNFFIAGICIGLAAFFGRNHGIYSLAAMLWVMVYLKCCGIGLRPLTLRFLALSGGIGVGYMPMLLMFVFVPGFGAAYLDAIRFHFEQRTTNLPLPVPWPWHVPVTVYLPIIALREVLTGFFFLVIIPFGVLSTFFVFRHGLRGKAVAPELVACAALSLPYAHYAFSRADLAHLSHSIAAFLVGLFVLLRQWPRIVRWTIAALVTGASLIVMAQMHYGWTCRPSQNCVDADVAGSTLRVAPETAADLAMLKSFVNQFAPNGTNFVVTPFWPGAYALFRQKSPMWEIYALFPRSENFQRAEIARIKDAAPGFILVVDIALDKRDDLRFRATHPLIDQFIRENFERVATDNYPAHYQLYTNFKAGPRQSRNQRRWVQPMTGADFP
jgi:hypothetical protein